MVVCDVVALPQYITDELDVDEISVVGFVSHADDTRGAILCAHERGGEDLVRGALDASHAGLVGVCVYDYVDASSIHADIAPGDGSCPRQYVSFGDADFAGSIWGVEHDALESVSEDGADLFRIVVCEYFDASGKVEIEPLKVSVSEEGLHRICEVDEDVDDLVASVGVGHLVEFVKEDDGVFGLGLHQHLGQSSVTSSLVGESMPHERGPIAGPS